MKFFGADILHVGQGQCQFCAQKVMRILVNDGSHRSWRTVLPENGKYVIHSCPEMQVVTPSVPTAPEAA